MRRDGVGGSSTHPIRRINVYLRLLHGSAGRCEWMVWSLGGVRGRARVDSSVWSGRRAARRGESWGCGAGRRCVARDVWLWGWRCKDVMAMLC